MTPTSLDLSRRVFEEPPDDIEHRAGALVLNWAGATGREGVEIARAYATAGRRLLASARAVDEAWECIDPILFCFRHALELYLKALVPGNLRRVHPMDELAGRLQRGLQGRYRPEQINWLCDRINEFDCVDPRSTSFRYHDAVDAGREAELWIDFAHLRVVMEAIFEALEKIYRDSPLARGAAARRD
jgi:HEPN domain-containing protein